jgi:uncharacterized protein (TIGR00369 family)
MGRGRKSTFVPIDPDFDARVRDSFGRQRAMATIGARLARLQPGLVSVELPFRDDLTQQNGFVHAGIIAAIADSAGGYAGYSLFAADREVLTVEFKLNLLRPARGDLLATGRVLKHGRRLTVCELAVAAEGKLCAFGTQTLIAVVADARASR